MSLFSAYLLSFATCADNSAKSTLPICPVTCDMASQSSQKVEKAQKKRVRFPSAVLMQQAITEGDADEIKQLISEHGNKVVEEREPSGLPPVMRAVFESQTHCLKVLVEAGADLTARDEENWTALHVAAAMDDMEVAEFIVSSCHDNLTQVRNVEGERPIDLSESTEMARFLLNADLRDFRIAEEKSEKSEGQDSAQEISEAAILRVVNEHYERSSDYEALNTVLRTNTCYDTLLHMAASKNYPRLANYILQHKIMDTECRDRRSWTAMHTAAYYNSLDVALLLVEYGASVHALADTYEKPSDLTENELIQTLLKSEDADFVY